MECQIYEVYIEDLYDVFFARNPQSEEKMHWIKALRDGMSEREVFEKFKASEEYARRSRIKPAHPIGHYYSPVVDAEEARRHWTVDRHMDPAEIRGVDISLNEMLTLWEALLPYIASSNFSLTKRASQRFYLNNGYYELGDAAILRAMILHFQPSTIVEIGSGFSSACMLDTLDEAGMRATRVTFVEPYPQRLRELVRESDTERCTLLERAVQAAELSTFDLVENDILFIDSSHVLKTGSDVNFELFEILPRLRKGVIIHFHDVHYPFDYPEDWVLTKMYSWNEVYALRAFLMYNSEFEIIYFNHFVAQKCKVLSRGLAPELAQRIMLNPGGGLWLRRV